jgi:hypothetical protein
MVASGTILYAIYDTSLKPAEFQNLEAPASGIDSGYYRYCYYELSAEEQAIYTVILGSIYDMPERIEIPKLITGNLNKIFTALSYDNPDLFCLGLNCKVYKEGLKTYFEPTYALNKETYQKQKTELEAVVPAILKGAEKYTSAYEKELYIHDYLVTNCVYVDPEVSSFANTAYGCIVNGKASCEGYARAFQYLLSKLNIDNRLVTGESTEDGENYIGHMWNYVLLDGEGYFVDVTWDDPKTATQVLRHTFFNVTTDDILLEHRNIEQNLPLCTAKKYNYFVYENAFVNNVETEQLEAAVENAVFNSNRRGYKCVELRFNDAASLNTAKDTLFNTGVIYTIYHDLGIIKDLNGAKVYYSTDEKMNALCLFF